MLDTLHVYIQDHPSHCCLKDMRSNISKNQSCQQDILLAWFPNSIIAPQLLHPGIGSSQWIHSKLRDKFWKAGWVPGSKSCGRKPCCTIARYCKNRHENCIIQSIHWIHVTVVLQKLIVSVKFVVVLRLRVSRTLLSVSPWKRQRMTIYGCEISMPFHDFMRHDEKKSPYMHGYRRPGPHIQTMSARWQVLAMNFGHWKFRASKTTHGKACPPGKNIVHTVRKGKERKRERERRKNKERERVWERERKKKFYLKM